MSAFWQKHGRKLLPAALFAAAVIAALVFWSPLVAWFSGDPAARTPTTAPTKLAASSAAPARAEEPTMAAHELAPAGLASVETALSAYEEVRSRLAADTLDGVAPAARRLEQSLSATRQTVKDAPELEKTLESGAQAAKQLSAASDIGAARGAFGDVGRALVRVAGADPRLQKGRHVFECPMVKGYNRWIQPSEQMANPYMGKQMLTCGSEADFAAKIQPAEHAAHAAGGDEIAHYTCPMHPSVKQPLPGKCPICGMDLTPVTKAEVETGVIIIDAARRQLIGVKTAKVEKRKLDKQIRTVGKITYDETRIHDVTIKFKGFIGQLFADATGKRVKRGQALFTVYSPEVYQAQQDLLIARGSGGDTASGSSGHLLESAKRRLELWDVTRGTIQRVLEKKKPMRYVPIVSPASGYIVQKNVFDGSAVEPGMLLLRIANLDKVWIEAELYEAELPLVEVGQSATVTLSYLPDKHFTGKITFVYPYLSGATRTGKVRIELENAKVELKPDMYANVELSVERGERLVVPESAVIYAGPRRLVFLDLGEGKLRPQEIEIGVKTGDWYEVRKGLSAGQKVVTSGNFLVAAESRLKSASGQW